ncbi:hypothetical protein BH09SUM1_BH09SUM1_19420 [soil metagenome]
MGQGGIFAFMAKKETILDGKSERAARSVQIAIICLGVYLLLINVTGFILIRENVKDKEESLANYLSNAGTKLVLPARDYFDFLEFTWDPATKAIDDDSVDDYRQTQSWKNLEASLESTTHDPAISRADILTLSGEILLQRDGVMPVGDARRAYKEDMLEIARAARGEQVSPPNAPLDFRKRTYTPVRSTDGRMVAILRLEVNPEEFRDIRQSRRRFLIGFIVSILFVVFLWFLTLRLLRRTLEAERAMGQGDRLRAIGEMTAGIAHEIRNPLGILALQVEELMAFLPQIQDPKLRGNFAMIANELKGETARLKDLTETFLDYSRASSNTNFEAVAINVDGVLSQILKLWTKGLNPAKRKIAYEIDDRTLKVMFTEDRLRQIILNLLRNADEALGAREGQIAIHVATEGQFASISISDDGPGIDAALLSQIFDPFFTTRAEGTGLGLSLSRALAESAGGKLTVQSKKGQGAAFKLELRRIE